MEIVIGQSNTKLLALAIRTEGGPWRVFTFDGVTHPMQDNDNVAREVPGTMRVMRDQSPRAFEPSSGPTLVFDDRYSTYPEGTVYLNLIRPSAIKAKLRDAGDGGLEVVFSPVG